MTTTKYEELPFIERPKLTAELIKAVKEQQEVLLLGPGYWGKTDVLRNIEQQFKKEGIAIYLSLFTLRCRSPEILEKEILRWLTQNEEQVRTYTQQAQNAPFQAYLENQKEKKKPILLLCDQLEDLSTSKEIHAWLTKFRLFLKANNILVIWSERVATIEKSSLRESSEILAYEIEPLTKEEMISWFEKDKFNYFSKQSLLIDKLYEVTNGVDGLIKNFALYLVNNEFQNNIVDQYVKYQSYHYSRSCHSILQALRNYPHELTTWETEPSDELKEHLWLSGAFIKKENQLVISSIIYKNRLEKLISLENLLKSGIRINNIKELFDKKMEEKNQWLHELKSEPLIYYFLRENDKEKILKDLRDYLLYLGYQNIEFYLRESEHWLVWYKINFSAKKERWFLRTDTIFYKAVHSGSLKIDIDDNKHRCFIPLTGSSGLVNFVISGEPPEKIFENTWKLEFYLRNIFSVIQNLSPIIMRSVDNYLLSYANKGLKSLFHYAEKNELKDEKYGTKLVKEMQSAVSIHCSTWAIIAQDEFHENKWELCTLKSNKDYLSKISYFSDRLADNDTIQKLNELIDYHKKTHKKYLIKNSNDLESLVKCFYQEDINTTFFIRAVPIDTVSIESKRKHLLVIFVFPHENEIPPVFNYFEREYLSLLGLRFSRVEYVKRRLNKRHQDEIELLNKIGAVTSLSLADPQRALREILVAMQKFFNVSAIAINIIVDVYDVNNKNTHKETRMLSGLGYLGSYPDDEKHSLEGKSRTAYVAREGKTIMASSIGTTGSYNNYEFKPNDYGGELHLIKDNIGYQEGICGASLKEEYLYTYLGAPINWHNADTNKQEIIGVLKMANHLPKGEDFDTNLIASAWRIGQLLSPLIYMIQHRHQYGLEKQVEYLNLLFRGIGHELKTPLVKLDTALSLLEQQAIPGQKKLFEQCFHYKQQFIYAINSLQELAIHDQAKPETIPLIAKLQQIWQETFEDSKITLNCDIHESITVTIDIHHLERIFYNLFSNAIEALQDNEKAQITISAIKTEKNNIEVIFSDNGTGVPESIQDRLFNPYVSGHKDSVLSGKPYQLRGIGLTIAKVAVNNSGGKLSYAPELSKSSFKITIPSY